MIDRPALLAAALDAAEKGNQPLLEILAEMAHTPASEPGLGDPTAEHVQEAQDRVRGYMAEFCWHKRLDAKKGKTP